MTPPSDWPTPARPAGGARAEDGVRIGDAERERAVTDLGDHYAAGRLDRDELDERLELAWRARTAVDLRPLFADLPSGGTSGGVAVRPQNESGPVRRRGLRGGPPFGFPPPVLFLIALAIMLTIVTHVPFVLFFVWWLVIGGFLRGGVRRRTYAFRS